MHIIIWEYAVKKETQPEFLRIYSIGGDWAVLFEKYPGYLGTELLRDTNNPRRFLTIDRWESEEAYRSFRQSGHADYETLNSQCEILTESESLVGYFSLP